MELYKEIAQEEVAMCRHDGQIKLLSGAFGTIYLRLKDNDRFQAFNKHNRAVSDLMSVEKAVEWIQGVLQTQKEGEEHWVCKSVVDNATGNTGVVLHVDPVKKKAYCFGGLYKFEAQLKNLSLA